MEPTPAIQFVNTSLSLSAMLSGVESQAAEVARLVQRLEDLEKEASELELTATGNRIRRAREYVSSLPNGSLVNGDIQLKHDMRVLRETLEDDLSKRLVFFLSQELTETWLKSGHPFGDSVWDAFPSARSDISWAGYSLITDNFTACIFYVVRAVEHAMREIAYHLRVKKIGKKKIPLEYSEWGPVCGAVNKKIEALQQKMKRGSRKSTELDFYSRAIREIEWFNEIWRKNVAHARTLYNKPAAENAMIRAHDFFQPLATRMSEKA